MDNEYDINNYIVDCRFMLYVHCETDTRIVLGRHTAAVRSRESVDLLVENRCSKIRWLEHCHSCWNL